MIGSLMMCLSAVVLLVGMLAGITMGIQQNFMLAPAHAHLNLIGGVLLFLFGEPETCIRQSLVASKTPIITVSTDHFMCQLVSVCIPSFHAVLRGRNRG